MRARWALSVLAIALAVVLGCGPKVKPGLGVVGEKTVAKFDRAMVAADKLGQDVADAPVRIKPAVPGKFRWLDARTLTFVATRKPAALDQVRAGGPRRNDARSTASGWRRR